MAWLAMVLWMVVAAAAGATLNPDQLGCSCAGIEHDYPVSIPGPTLDPGTYALTADDGATVGYVYVWCGDEPSFAARFEEIAVLEGVAYPPQAGSIRYRPVGDQPGSVEVFADWASERLEPVPEPKPEADTPLLETRSVEPLRVQTELFQITDVDTLIGSLQKLVPDSESQVRVWVDDDGEMGRTFTQDSSGGATVHQVVGRVAPAGLAATGKVMSASDFVADIPGPARVYARSRWGASQESPPRAGLQGVVPLGAEAACATRPLAVDDTCGCSTTVNGAPYVMPMSPTPSPTYDPGTLEIALPTDLDNPIGYIHVSCDPGGDAHRRIEDFVVKRLDHPNLAPFANGTHDATASVVLTYGQPFASRAAFYSWIDTEWGSAQYGHAIGAAEVFVIDDESVFRGAAWSEPTLFGIKRKWTDELRAGGALVGRVYIERKSGGVRKIHQVMSQASPVSASTLAGTSASDTLEEFMETAMPANWEGYARAVVRRDDHTDAPSNWNDTAPPAYVGGSDPDGTEKFDPSQHCTTLFPALR